MAPPLPAALAFLVRHGVPPATLRDAADIARQLDIPADQALLRSGLATADTFYRALAREVGLPFLDGGFRVHPQALVKAGLATGLVPLEEGTADSRYAFAPCGDQLVELLGRRGAIASGIAIATPGAIREAVFAAHGEAIARDAAEDLPRRRPRDSFHGGLTLGQILVLDGFAALSGAALLFAPGLGWLLLAAVLGVPFTVLVVLKLAALFDRIPTVPRLPPSRQPDRDLPVYSVLVPLSHEARILPQLLDALLALDYPAAKLDIKFLIEADDGETASALASQHLPPHMEVVVVPAGLPRTKPRALNVGLALARGDLVVVYDAEDVPDPGQLRLAVATFGRAGPDVACLQARLVIDNASAHWLTRFFAVEYAALFDILNPALAHWELPVPLGGTSNHLRTDILRQVGGWDAWNVTEDADLGIRLAVAGYRVADLPSATQEEAPASLRAWLAQRTRWMKGYLQVVVTHSRQPLGSFRRLGPLRFLAAIALTYGAIVSALVYPVSVAVVASEIAAGRFLRIDSLADIATWAIALVLLGCGPPAMILPGLLALKGRRLLALWPFALLLPFYYLLVSIAAWRGVWELLRAPQRWNKTEHGLGRASRLRAAAPAPSRPPPGDARR